jgi:hypothetical protein
LIYENWQTNGITILFSQQVLRSVRLPNTACTDEVGLCAFSSSFCDFKFFLLPNHIQARPLAGNAQPWGGALLNRMTLRKKTK